MGQARPRAPRHDKTPAQWMLWRAFCWDEAWLLNGQPAREQAIPACNQPQGNGSLPQKTQLKYLWLELFGQRRVGGFKWGEVHGGGVAAAAAGFQGVADLVPAHVSAVEFEFVAHAALIGVGEVGFP